MPKFILHAGPPKTGSTYLQMSLRALAPQLKAAGVLYPDVWWTHPGQFNHATLLHGIISSQDADFEAGFRQFQESDAHTILLSSEGFGGLKRQHLARLRALMGDNECEVVFYTRRWSDWVPSQWQEGVKAGRTETFPEACARTYRDPTRPPINFGLHLDWLSEIFDRQSLRLISLSNLIDGKIDLVRHFCDSVLGLPDLSPPQEGQKINESRDPFMSELGRALNVLKSLRGEKPAVRALPLLARLRVHPDLKDDVDMVLGAMQSSAASIVLDDNLPPLRDIYAKILSKYHGSLLNPGPSDGFFEKRARAASYVRQDYLLQPGTSDAISRISAYLDDQLSRPSTTGTRAARAARTDPAVV